MAGGSGAGEGPRTEQPPPAAPADEQSDAQAQAQAHAQGQGQVQAYGYGVPAAYPQWQVSVRQPSNGMATAGMVLGITCIVFSWWGLFTLAQVVLAITFGAIGLNRANTRGAPGRGQAIAGIVLGVIGCCAYVVFGIFTLGIGFLI
jgi:Domain of unknown function (DUF4190)